MVFTIPDEHNDAEEDQTSKSKDYRSNTTPTKTLKEFSLFTNHNKLGEFLEIYKINIVPIWLAVFHFKGRQSKPTAIQH